MNKALFNIFGHVHCQYCHMEHLEHAESKQAVI
jgi:hypothetical protein